VTVDSIARGEFEPIPKDVEAAAEKVVDAAIEVHRHLGPGFLEAVYEKAMVHEIELRGLTVQRQIPLVLHYKGLQIDGQRLDLLVEPGIIVELKAVERLLPLHRAQIISYLRTTGRRLGLLINFNRRLLKGGIKRIVF